MSHNLTTDYDALLTEERPVAPGKEQREPTARPTGQHTNAQAPTSNEGNLGFVDFAGRNIDDGPEGARAYGEDGTLKGTEEEEDGSASFDPDDSAVSGHQIASRHAGVTGKGAGLAAMKGISGGDLKGVGLSGDDIADSKDA